MVGIGGGSAAVCQRHGHAFCPVTARKPRAFRTLLGADRGEGASARGLALACRLEVQCGQSGGFFALQLPDLGSTLCGRKVCRDARHAVGKKSVDELSASRCRQCGVGGDAGQGAIDLAPMPRVEQGALGGVQTAHRIAEAFVTSIAGLAGFEGASARPFRSARHRSRRRSRSSQ